MGTRPRLRPGEHTAVSYRYSSGETAHAFTRPKLYLFFIVDPLPWEFYLMNLLQALDADQLYVLCRCARRALRAIFNMPTIMANECTIHAEGELEVQL